MPGCSLARHLITNILIFFNEEINILKENDTSNDADPMIFNPRDLMIQMMKGMDIKKLN